VWEYRALPEELRMPPCPRCANRGRVSQFARFAYYCGDCRHAYAAVWRDEPKQVTAPRILDKTSATMGVR
jgi:hypothetical protein